MDENSLFGVDSSGKVRIIGDSKKKWEDIPYVGLDLKRVTASERFLWGIGSDHRVYVFVFETEVPIRIKECTYENQRWKPVMGFSNSLLPTDRSGWSTADGLREKTRESVKRPSLAWEWESEWYLETSFKGTRLDSEGWTYAVDFPAEYYPAKKFSSCVRRRKWCRYRRYVAMETWAPIPSVHEDISEEPFIDISVGGQELPNSDPDEVFVWSVTILGRVMVRLGVRVCNPEGSGWLHIPTPNECEVSQITVGPTGLVWAVTWQGKALVRLGVSRINPTGIRWTEVDFPISSPLMHVSLGENSLWALSRDHRVWFRNGVRGASAGDVESYAKGSKWIEMVGQLQMISVSPNDQVIGIEANEDRTVVFRTGVVPSDLSGKTWRPLNAEISEKPASIEATVTVIAGSSNANFGKSTLDSPAEPYFSEKTKKKAANVGNTLAKEVACSTATALISRVPVIGHPASMIARKIIQEELQDLSLFDEEKSSDIKESDQRIDESMYVSALQEQQPSKEELPIRIRQNSFGSLTSEVPVVDREDQQGFYDPSISDSVTRWLWVSAEVCRFTTPPAFWFRDTSLTLDNEPWRMDILNNLKKNNNQINDGRFRNYESSVERSSWIKKGQCRVMSSFKSWEDCAIELEQTGSGDQPSETDFGALSIFGLKRIKEHISLNEITCVSQSGEKTLSVFTSKQSCHLTPIQFKFNSSSEKEAWQAQLVTAINSMRGTTTAPSKGSIYSVTFSGEVCVFDPVSSELNASMDNGNDKPLYSQELPLAGKPTPMSYRLENGFIEGSYLQFVMEIFADAHEFAINLTNEPLSPGCGPSSIHMHLTPRLYANKVVLNSFKSGFWEKEEMASVFTMTEDGDAVKAFAPGKTVNIIIKAEDKHFVVLVNGFPYAKFAYRLSLEDLSHLEVHGDVSILSVKYNSKFAILAPQDMYWRVLGGGHLSRVISSRLEGIVWGIGYDFTPWVYTGGWGGAHFKGISDGDVSGINPMSDTKYYYIYENQRWNPLTGFTAHGLLPTDRYAWSDRSGRVSLTKDSIKPPSKHWQWISEWLVSFDTPGGVDKDGWQYATDFPSNYKGKLATFAYVRRRRWMRKCRLNTTGPWRKFGSTKLVDVSIGSNLSPEGNVNVWAVASNGDALFRKDVSPSNPEGSEWLPYSADVPFQSISISTDDKKVWAIGKDGHAYLRSPCYEVWMQVHPPNSYVSLKLIEAGDSSTVWAIDSENKLYFRKDISDIKPEGSSWSMPICEENVKEISVSCEGEVWAILESLKVGGKIVVDAIAKRIGITGSLPQGTAWDYSIGPGWKQVCVRSKICQRK